MSTETTTPSTTHAKSELAIRRHLARFCPPVGGEPHVWVAPIAATAQDTEQWLDIGPLDAVCRDYPDVAKILRGWFPTRLLSSSGILNLTSTLRCQVALIGEVPRG